jgi:hypothetical protein
MIQHVNEAICRTSKVTGLPQEEVRGATSPASSPSTASRA